MTRSISNAVLIVLISVSANAASQLRNPNLPNDKTHEQWVDEAKQKLYSTISPDDEKGFVRMRAPKLGEWLQFYKETPQTLERYQLSVKVRPSPERKALVIQPLGELDQSKLQVMEKMREYAEIFFQLPARLEKPLPLAAEGTQLFKPVPINNRHGTYDKQYDGDKVMEAVLEKRIPPDAIAYLGITMEDLYSGDLNYVFGIATLKKRVGVYSLCRYYPEFWGQNPKPANSEITGLRRACKVLNHETGHMFGITHCIFYHCSMNGSNTLAETDEAPMHFCPLCQRKLAWNIGFDTLKQYEQLEAFYRRNELIPEADWMVERIKNWKKVVEEEKIKKTADE